MDSILFWIIIIPLVIIGIVLYTIRWNYVRKRSLEKAKDINENKREN